MSSVYRVHEMHCHLLTKFWYLKRVTFLKKDISFISSYDTPHAQNSDLFLYPKLFRSNCFCPNFIFLLSLKRILKISKIQIDTLAYADNNFVPLKDLNESIRLIVPLNLWSQRMKSNRQQLNIYNLNETTMPSNGVSDQTMQYKEWKADHVAYER